MTEELDQGEKFCYYCDSDNDGIQELFCDSNCQNCLDRHFKRKDDRNYIRIQNLACNCSS